MTVSELMQTFRRMLLPPPNPSKKHYTLLGGEPPPTIQTVARADTVSMPSMSVSTIENLSLDEKWISSIYYCQGVIRANVEGGSIHFRELDAGIEDLKLVSTSYQLPQLSDRPPAICYRFAEADLETWKRIYQASKSSQKELLVRVAANLRNGAPIPTSLSGIVADHLVNPEVASVSEREKKRTGDRDTLFVWLAKRVSDVCTVSVAGALDKILQKPLQLTGVTVASVAFSGLGYKIGPRRAVRIWEENKYLLQESRKFPYLLVPDFLAAPIYGSPSIIEADDAMSQMHRDQMEGALQCFLSPDLGNE